MAERLRDSFVLANKDKGSGAVAGWPLAARKRGRAPQNSQPAMVGRPRAANSLTLTPKFPSQLTRQLRSHPRRQRFRKFAQPEGGGGLLFVPAPAVWAKHVYKMWAIPTVGRQPPHDFIGPWINDDDGFEVNVFR